MNSEAAAAGSNLENFGPSLGNLDLESFSAAQPSTKAGKLVQQMTATATP